MDDGVVQGRGKVYGLPCRRRAGIVGRLPGLDPGGEVEIRQGRLQLVHVSGVVGLVLVPGRYVVPVIGGDAGLQIQEPVGLVHGLALVRGIGGQPQEPGDHLLVLLTDRLIVGFAVIGLIG